MQWFKDRWETFRWLFVYKLISTGIQLYIGSLIATNGSSEEPWLKLQMIAHLGAMIAALRGIDALLDPIFNGLKPEELKNNMPH
jgi:hypothetical protein